MPHSDSLGNSAPLPTITHNGKTYSFSYITHGMMAAMERHLFAKLTEPLISLKAGMDPDHYNRKMDEWLDRQEKGEFAFENRRCQDYLKTADGAIKMVSLLIGASEDELLEMYQVKGAEINALFEQSMRQSFPTAKKPKSSPKGRGRVRAKK